MESSFARGTRGTLRAPRYSGERGDGSDLTEPTVQQKEGAASSCTDQTPGVATDRKPKKAATHTFPGTVLLEDTRAKAPMGDGWWFGKERKPV